MKSKKFTVNNIEGENDINYIRNTLSSMKGVNAVRVDTVANTVTVDYDENAVSANQLNSEIQNFNNDIR
ncbi:heavy-metal-associated domain-containing protein [Caldisalinibacter kiritimatiensis]|uniref:HMA domain-containing protein n=1 Tax=Caldisalinibacter kiritimatiensis TaxID=1304284 RepID=R1AY58_9FIRM|nr:heavy-metal-associated domain-containing protein [Caldisalinibacter kiritimatiensis]EOD01602.1 hypothetical protein L21TH_0341 [Caldisalinibacter kiritimatiensis]